MSRTEKYLAFEPPCTHPVASLAQINRLCNDAYVHAYAGLGFIEAERLGRRGSIVLDLFIHLNDCSKAVRGAIWRGEYWAASTLLRGQFEACAISSYLSRVEDESVWASFVSGALLGFARTVRTIHPYLERHLPFDRSDYSVVEKLVPSADLDWPKSFEQLVAKRDTLHPAKSCKTSSKPLAWFYSPVYRGMSSAVHSDFLFVRGASDRAVDAMEGKTMCLVELMSLSGVLDCIALNDLVAFSFREFDTGMLDEICSELLPLGKGNLG